MQKSSLFTSSTYKAQPFTSFDGRSLLRNINGTELTFALELGTSFKEMFH